MTWLVTDYIKYYEGVMTDLQCEEILGCTDSVFVPSTYSDNEGKIKINHVISKKSEHKGKKSHKLSYQEKMKQIKTKHKNAYKPWTNAEELELLNLFMRKISISKIANKLNRQPGGIKARLKKLNVID